MEPSRFAALMRWPARAVLLLLAALILAALLRAPAAVPKNEGTASDRADVMLYETIVARVRGGENYYAAAADAQRQGGYPLKPFVTMRPPTLAMLQAALPGRAASAALLYLLCAATLAAWLARLKASGLPMRRAVIGALLVFAGSATLLLPDLLHWHEAWAGLLIALSLALRSDRRFAASLIGGLAAVLIREIAVAYLLVMLAAALIERRRGEALAWAGAIAIAAAFVVWHATNVLAVTQPDDLASQGWSVVGGWTFAVTMFWLTGPLRLAPYWSAALLVPVAMLGWAGWNGMTGLRGAALIGGYAVTFALFGRPDNFYWAFLLAPLLPLGLFFAVPALRDLVRASR